MHVVSSGVQRHLISQPAPVAVQGPVNVNSANTSSTAPANRLIHNVSAQGLHGFFFASTNTAK